MTDSSTTQLVGVAIPTLRELRAAVLTSAGPDAAVAALRESGFAGGDAVLAAFESWLAESGSTADARDLDLTEFASHAAQFFRDAGWGEMTFTPDEAEGIATVEIDRCWEAVDMASEATGCQITTGALASFFGKIAGYPVAVLETSCANGDGSSCRFMLGNADMMNYKWQEMQ